VRQDRPHHVGQTLWILDCAVLIQRADCEEVTTNRRARAKCGSLVATSGSQRAYASSTPVPQAWGVDPPPCPVATSTTSLAAWEKSLGRLRGLVIAQLPIGKKFGRV
jgi:hypothetical protein